MNKVCLIGRSTSDGELKQTTTGRNYVKFTLAVDRGLGKEARESGKQTADFISCVAWGQTAEFLNKYIHKGDRIGLIGKIQTGSYTNNDGNKVYTTDVFVENTTLLESKKENMKNAEDDSMNWLPF